MKDEGQPDAAVTQRSTQKSTPKTIDFSSQQSTHRCAIYTWLTMQLLECCAKTNPHSMFANGICMYMSYCVKCRAKHERNKQKNSMHSRLRLNHTLPEQARTADSVDHLQQRTSSCVEPSRLAKFSPGLAFVG